MGSQVRARVSGEMESVPFVLWLIVMAGVGLGLIVYGLVHLREL